MFGHRTFLWKRHLASEGKHGSLSNRTGCLSAEMELPFTRTFGISRLQMLATVASIRRVSICTGSRLNASDVDS